MSKTLYRLSDYQVFSALCDRGLDATHNDGVEIASRLEKGEAVETNGLKLKPEKGDKFRVYDMRDAT